MKATQELEREVLQELSNQGSSVCSFYLGRVGLIDKRHLQSPATLRSTYSIILKIKFMGGGNQASWWLT